MNLAFAVGMRVNGTRFVAAKTIDIFDVAETPAEEKVLAFLRLLDRGSFISPLRWFLPTTDDAGRLQGAGLVRCTSSNPPPGEPVVPEDPEPIPGTFTERTPDRMEEPQPEPIVQCKPGDMQVCGPCGIGVSYCTPDLIWGLCEYSLQMLIRGCYTGLAETRGVGACGDGVQRCFGDTWGECEKETKPVTESCDGKDNDCDGVVDEADGGVFLSARFYTGRANTQNAGICHEGVKLCVGGTWQTEEDQVTPQPEVCDFLDNDCDNQTDEMLRNVCGECLPAAVPMEICDGLDNDCDRQVDEGVQNACGGCGPVPVEICDREDNDCDGERDETGCGTRTGDPCTDLTQCMGRYCVTLYPGGYCSERIWSRDDGSECNAGTGWRTSVCVTLSEWGVEEPDYHYNFCVVTCEEDNDCRLDEGYRCKPIRNSDLKACLPDTEEVTVAEGNCAD